VHPVAVNGIAEKATIDFIIRDFETARLADHESRLQALAQEVLQRHPKASMEFKVREQYRNMKEIVSQHPRLTANAAEAYQRAGFTVRNEPIRGGTDGSRLSFMGLPCPNIFTGMQAIHSRHEWIGVKDMEKAVEVLVHLAAVWEERGE
jgi:tripeptide aminopeptidase